MKITKTAIERLKPAADDVWIWDSELPGFGVRVRPSGRKTYVARYRTLSGVQRKQRIARCCDMTPEQARELARQVFAAVAAGGDPISERRAAETEENSKTVEKMFQGYVASMKARNRESAGEVERALLKAKDNAADALGRHKPATAITPTDIVDYVSTFYATGRRGAANKHRGYICSAYNWAMTSANDYTVPAEQRTDWGVTRNPAAAVAKDPGAVGTRDRNLSASELRTLWMATAPGSAGFLPETASCIRLLICCGQRVQETLRIEGRDIDLQESLWRMPPEKTKGRKFPHEIPLTKQAVDILEGLLIIHGDGPLFPARYGAKGEIMKHISVMQALKRWQARDGVDMPPFQTRDLRRTWKSRAHDAGISKEMRDRIQQHSQSDTSSKHYDRAVYLPQMREAMQRWEDWIVENLEPSAAGAQRLVGALAGEAGSAGLISESSNSVRSRVKAALHVGEHSGGGVGCLA